MTTTREVTSAAAERRRRERRHYGPESRGPRCPVCKTYTVRALVEIEGRTTHPSCEGVRPRG